MESLLTDNIADDRSDDLEQFIKDFEQSSTTPNVADLYMKHLNATNINDINNINVMNINNMIDINNTIDDTESLNSQPDVIEQIGLKLKGVGKSSSDLYQPDISGYSDHRKSFSKWYSPSPAENTVNITDIADCVDNIYHYVKSTDEQIENIYEKSLAAGDSIEEILSTLRARDIDHRVQQIEANQQTMKAQLDDIIDFLKKLRADVMAIRYGPEE